MKKVLLSAILLFVLNGILHAQLNVVKIDNNAVPLTKEGIFYSLPRTVVNVEVTIEKIEHYKGPYSEYALRFLGLKNVVTANAVEYRINDITITTYPEPDPEQYYFIELGEKVSKGEKGSLLSLTDAGVILGTLPLPNPAELPGRTPANKGELSENEDVFGELFRYSADMSVFEKVDTIIRKINIDTMTVERQYLKRTMVEKSPEQKAKEAADFITKIKENRFTLVSGQQEVNYNKETLEYMDSQLKTMEKEYLKLFTGVSLEKQQTYQYKYIPISTQINTAIPIFKFISSKGVVDLDESGGKIVTIKVQRVGNTNSVSAYLSRAQKETKSRGFYYRIPELGRVTVKLDDNTQEEKQCMINQLGVVTNLPSNRGNVMFHPETGGIRELDIQ
jgi:hypothetical protein